MKIVEKCLSRRLIENRKVEMNVDDLAIFVTCFSISINNFFVRNLFGMQFRARKNIQRNDGASFLYFVERVARMVKAHAFFAC